MSVQRLQLELHADGSLADLVAKPERLGFGRRSWPALDGQEVRLTMLFLWTQQFHLVLTFELYKDLEISNQIWSLKEKTKRIFCVTALRGFLKPHY